MNKIDILSVQNEAGRISGDFQDGEFSREVFDNKINNLINEVKSSRSRKKAYLLSIIEHAYKMGIKYAPKDEEEAKARQLKAYNNRAEELARY